MIYIEKENPKCRCRSGLGKWR